MECAIVPLIILAISIFLSDAHGDEATSEPFPDLPYRVVSDPSFGLEEQGHGRFGNASVWGDIDGDGLDEWFRAFKGTVMALRPDSLYPSVIWQRPVRPPFHRLRPVAELSLDFDLEGDGRPDLVAVSADSSGVRTHIEILDPSTGRVKSTGGLSMRDGTLRGRDLGRPRPCARRRGAPRCAGGSADPPVGRRLRHRRSRRHGPGCGDGGYRLAVRHGAETPILRTVAWRNLDGDGRREIVVSANGVGNLGGERINGTSDDSTHVFVLDGDGGLLWRRAFLAAPSGTVLEIDDFDGDGSTDVVCAAYSRTNDMWRLLRLEGATGRIDWEAPDPPRCASLGRGRTDSSQPPILLAGTVDGRLERRRCDTEGAMPVLDAVVLPHYINRIDVADALGTGSEQILVCLGHMGIAILDGSLKTLAYAPTPEFSPNWTLKPWRVSGERTVLLTTGRPREAIRFERVRHLPRWMLAAGICRSHSPGAGGCSATGAAVRRWTIPP